MDVNVNMTTLLLILANVFATSTYAACICRDATPQAPFWEVPCGTPPSSIASGYNETKPYKKHLMDSMKVIKRDLKSCLHFYSKRNYTLMTNDVAIFQNWLPNADDIRQITVRDIHEVPSKVHKNLYTKLQKYAMVFSLMLDDNTNKRKQNFVGQIVVHLKALLCDLQDALVWFEESIQTAEELPKEYIYEEDTYKHLRDNEVIYKYGKFLKQWLQFVGTTKKSFRKGKRKNQKKKGTTKNS